MASKLDKIRALQNKLKNVQKQKQKQRLSERNMIEIVSKLSDMKLVNLIMSTDGKEYITPQFLTNQIIETINDLGNGRLSIVEISDYIKVEFSTVERFVNQIIADQNSQPNQKYKLLNNQLITSHYFETIALQIVDEVIFKGKLSFNDIAIQYDLGIEILTQELLPIIKQVETSDKSIFIQKEPDVVIYAKEYTILARRKIFGTLRAINFPVNLSEILALNGLNKNFDIFSVVKEFIADKNNQIEGEILSKSIFIPKIYTDAQKAWIVSTFTSNLYIDFDQLSKIGITSNQKKFVLDTLKSDLPNFKKSVEKNLIFINNGIVSKDLFADLEANLFECEKFLNLSDLFPSFIEVDEYEKILSHFFDGKNNDDFVVLENCLMIFKKSFLENVMLEHFQSYLVQQAEISADKNFSSQILATGAKNSEAEPAENLSKKDKRKNKKKGKKAAQEEDSSSIVENSTENSTNLNKTDLLEILETNLKAVLETDENFNMYEFESNLIDGMEKSGIEIFYETILEYLLPSLNAKFNSLANDLMLQMQEKKNNQAKVFYKTLNSSLQEKFELARCTYGMFLE